VDGSQIKLKRSDKPQKILDFLLDSPSVSAQLPCLWGMPTKWLDRIAKKNTWGKMLVSRFSNSSLWLDCMEEGLYD
jgi:hypothetical protein